MSPLRHQRPPSDRTDCSAFAPKADVPRLSYATREDAASGAVSKLRAEVAGNQVEEEVGGGASGASMFRLSSPRVRLRLPDQGEQS